MKIALFAVNGGYTHTNPAIRALGCELREEGHTVMLIEHNLRDRTDTMLDALLTAEADLYGFSCYIWNIGTMLELAADLKALRPSATIWLGGPEVSYAADRFADAAGVDYIISGEGEAAVTALARAIADGTPPRERLLFGTPLNLREGIVYGEDEDGNETTTLSFYNTFEYTVKLGTTVKDNEECRYAVVYHGDELVPMVYEVITSSLKWAEVQYDDLADPLLFFTYIDEVETISLTLDGKTTVFELTHYPDKEDADETMKVVSNGKRYNTATFRDLYQSLIGIMRVESTTDKPAGSPVLTVEVQVNTETSRDSWVKLYRYSAGKYLAEHDTGEIYLVGAKDVEETLKQCREFVK